MIQMQTLLNAADNSGARSLMCIKVLGGSKRRYATVGDVIKVSVRDAIPRGKVKKGDPLQTAIVAGIMAAKQTSSLIPLCHPLPLSKVTVDFEPDGGRVRISALVRTTALTGVEMEALHACGVAALTIYDMCKSADRAMVIGDLCLWEKTGGRSGTSRRNADA